MENFAGGFHLDEEGGLVPVDFRGFGFHRVHPNLLDLIRTFFGSKMPNIGLRVPRGTGGPHGDLVEAIPIVNNPGFGLQQTTLGQAQQPMNAIVAAVVGVGLPPINLSLCPGGLPNLMVGANVQADFAARFAAQYLVAGEVCVRFNSQIPGGGGWDVPIQATDYSFEHMVVVREAASIIEFCQRLDPQGIFIQVSVHGNVSRMPGGDNMHFMRHLFQYISTATRPQLVADNLDWILFWEWCKYDTLAGGTMGMTDGPGGPVIIGDPRSPGDMHAEGMLFVRAGYEGPEDVHPNAQAGWAALNVLLLSFGALDGAYVQNQAPHTRHGMYFNPLTLPRWKKHGDRTNYPAVFMVHNYVMRKKTTWRQSGGSYSIATQNARMLLMGVVPQRAIRTHDLPSQLATPIHVPPPAATNPRLPTRSIVVAVAP